MLNELDKNLEPFGEYYDLTKPSGDIFLVFYLKFWCFKKLVNDNILQFSKKGIE